MGGGCSCFPTIQMRRADSHGVGLSAAVQQTAQSEKPGSWGWRNSPMGLGTDLWALESLLVASDQSPVVCPGS